STHDLDLLEHLPAHHDDSVVALAEVLLGSIGDRALSDPRDEVLVHHVARDEPAGHRIFDRRVPVGDAVLPERLHLVRHAVEKPPDAERAGVVDGDAPLEVRSGEETVRPQTGAPHGPQLVRLRVAFHHAPVDEAVLELLEAELEVRRSLRPVPPAKHAGPVPVQPLEVHRIDRVLLGLKPVTRDFGEDDLDEAVGPGERLPGGHERRRRRPQVGPQESGLGLDRIGFDRDAVLEARLGVRDLFERLGEAVPRLAVQPAVVVAPQAPVFGEAVAQVSPPVSAVTVEEAVGTALVLVEDEVLAHQPHGLRRTIVQLRHGRDGHPVASEQLAHAGAGADFREGPVLLLAQHRAVSSTTGSAPRQVEVLGLTYTRRDTMTAVASRNVTFVSHSDQAGRSDGVQIMVHRGYAYIGHTFSNGITIMDVRDPKRPRAVDFIACPPNTRSIHLQTHDDLLLATNMPSVWTMQEFQNQQDYFAASPADKL